jgi:glycolate oxidase FAD binding subunit
LRQTRDGPAAAEEWSLIVGIDGPEPAVARQRRDIEALTRTAGATTWWTGPDDGSLWQTLQGRFRPFDAQRTTTAVIRVGTVRTHLRAVLDKLTQLEPRLNAPPELCARFGNGLIYARLALDGTAEQSAHLTRALTEVRSELASGRGYLTVESAPPVFKATFDCWGDLGPQMEIMAGLKRAFDPRRVLNPGRFIAHL